MPFSCASAVKMLPAASMAIPSPIVPLIELGAACGGMKIVTLPSLRLPIRMPLSQPGCVRSVDSESAVYHVALVDGQAAGTAELSAQTTLIRI
jgi:hypothetical protein